MVENVNILRGGSSAIFGGSSIGGTINMNLSEPKQELRASLGVGSFDEYSGSFSGTHYFGSVPVSVSFEGISSKGDFPFTTTQFGETKEYRRENAGFLNTNLILNTQFNEQGWLFKAIALGRYSKRGAPGPILLGYVKPNDAELEEKEVDLILKAETETNAGFFSSRFDPSDGNHEELVTVDDSDFADG